MYTTVPAFIIFSIAFGLLSPWNKLGDISTVEQFKIDILSIKVAIVNKQIPSLILSKNLYTYAITQKIIKKEQLVTALY